MWQVCVFLKTLSCIVSSCHINFCSSYSKKNSLPEDILSIFQVVCSNKNKYFYSIKKCPKWKLYPFFFVTNYTSLKIYLKLPIWRWLTFGYTLTLKKNFKYTLTLLFIKNIQFWRNSSTAVLFQIQIFTFSSFKLPVKIKILDVSIIIYNCILFLKFEKKNV